MEWISVESQKPKAITPVLICYKTPQLKRGMITVGEYVPPKTVRSEDFLNEDCDPGDLDTYDEADDCYYVNEGWFESSFISDQNWSLGCDVTHWAHLPMLPDSP